MFVEKACLRWFERETNPPCFTLMYSPVNCPMPVPKIVSASPVTFWLALRVMVMKLYMSEAMAPDAKAQMIAMTIAMNPLDAGSPLAAMRPAADIAFSYANAPASPNAPPMYIIPSTPRLRLPLFSQRISPVVPSMRAVANGMAATASVMSVFSMFISCLLRIRFVPGNQFAADFFCF